MICWALIPCAALLLLLRLGEGDSWPVGRNAAAYLAMGGMLPACGLVLWTIWSFTVVGDPRPLIYILFLNPVELVGLVSIATLVLWRISCQKKGCAMKYLPQKQLLWGAGMLFFAG